MPREPFELTGGHLGLDFANTVDERASSTPRERLETYTDLVAWALQAGVLTAAKARRLEREARGRADAAARVLNQARALREHLFALFAAAAAGRDFPIDDVDALNAPLGRALGRLRLESAGAAARWEWVDDPDALDVMLWPVVRAAADLLVSSDLALVRQCAADTCEWLFLDRSRNRSRRWCDMTICGNRAKARRHYSRRRETS
jgi:predicted RNA-binding Zn ribbon-like protein